MSAGALNIVIEQGATFNLNLLWTDSADAPVDLSGFTARMHVRQVPNSSAFIVELTTENGRIALGGAAGTIKLTIQAVDTEELPPGEFVYDLEMVASDAVVTRLVEGDCVIRAEVTRQ